MLIRIKNAYAASHHAVLIPFSKLKAEIAKILKKEGYIYDYEEVEDEKKKFIKIKLRYINQKPTISYVKRISKPGRRIYIGKDFRSKRSGGTSLVSTPAGIRTTRDLKKEGMGGELLCEIR